MQSLYGHKYEPNMMKFNKAYTFYKSHHKNNIKKFRQVIVNSTAGVYEKMLIFT